MKTIIKKISQAVQVVLLAPIKLPEKALSLLKYIAVGLGIMEKVLDGEEDDLTKTERKEGSDADNE
ncbi:hypothetical protein [Sphingobacterium chuzhouense]|uniref:Phage protein n=1 Tax=Sphingobacterium chuzhouense TaxID=1742264 RepID=A0ABR7XUQ4_9SPHI|nr:hypothetical protein [Sphingobacterium chuzhouense]MBD1422786.1 hypothetical protein [Sphingobacterium chuzhouense]